MNNSDNILEVSNLKQYFNVDRHQMIKAVDDVSFKIARGSTYSLVGESGSGKSTIGRAIIRLYKPTGGSISFNGIEIGGKLGKSAKKVVNRKMQMIFQDPMSSLNPRKKVMDIVAEGIDANRMYKTSDEREEMVFRMLERVGLSREFANRYPHMFSGGQRQRIGIARAMIMKPDLIVADECISALDVSIQAQVVNLMKDLQEERELTYLFIAHDLSMVKYISDFIGVIHQGHIVEAGTKEDIFSNAVHPYTKSLLSAIPEPNPLTERNKKLITYDKDKAAVDYLIGKAHYISDTHMILATDKELEAWTK